MIKTKNIFKVIEQAGEILHKSFYNDKSFLTKSNSNDLVTETDKQIELFLKDKLFKEMPGSVFLSEETDPDFKNDDVVWIIDPIDGTTNFVHQFPFVCISVALQINNQLELAVIYNPVLNEFFYAQKGQGAYLNNTRIFVNRVNDFSKCLLATGFAYNFSVAKENNIRFFEYLLPQVHGIRRPGSAALDLAYVAKGVYSGFWEWSLNPWDVCAGILLIKEAGGVVSNSDNDDWGFNDNIIIAGTKEIHPILLYKIRELL